MKNTNFVGLGCFLQTIISVVYAVVAGFCTQYTVGFWFMVLQHKTVHIPFIVAALVGIVSGPVMIPATLITWMLSFCGIG